MAVLKKLLICSAIIGLVILVLGLVLGFKVFPDMIPTEVDKSVSLEMSSQFMRWYKLPFPMTFNIYVFDVKNPEDIMLGAKPIVEEVGPFTYKQFRRKKEIEFDEDTNNPYEYQQYQLYEFDKENSPLSDETEVTVLNAAKYGVTQVMLDKLGATSNLYNLHINAIFPDSVDSLFHKIKVKNLFFDGYTFCKGLTGIPKLVCTIIERDAEKIPTMTVEKDVQITFSFFSFKNNTSEGKYTIKSSVDTKDLGQIIKFNDKDFLDTWNDENSTCNKVKGTDSSIYSPFNEKTDLTVFSADICRTVTLTYSEEVEYQDIPGYRSTMKDGSFSSMNEENDCFCINGTRNLDGNKYCFPDGFLDMSKCLKSPVVVSLPHLLLADETYANTVDGLAPNKEKHSTFVDLEPNTGTPLRGSKRIQFNMFLNQNDKLNVLNKIKPSVMPILWVEEKMNLPEDLVELLNDEYFSVIAVAEGVKWGLIAAGAVILLVTIVVYFVKR